ncbi:site-specific integrase [bacterium]|nr:site-specific integrase [bacterium]
MKISKGTLYKRGNVWWFAIRCDGKKIQKSLHTSIKEEALARFKKIKEDLLLGISPSVLTQKQISFFELVNKYEDFIVSNKSESTVRREKGILEKVKNYFGNCPVNSITQNKIEGYLNAQKVSNASLNREIAVLKHMFKKAVEWGYLKENPARKIKKLKVQEKKIRYLTDREIKRILDVCDEEWRDIFLFFLYTGLRLSEFVNLSWDDVDFKKGLIAVQKTKSYKARYIPMSKEIRSILKKWRKREKPCKFSADYISHKVREICKKVGIFDVSPHILRHTFASRLVMNGVPLRVVKELLGHSDIKTTMVYSHLAPDYMKGIEEKLNYKL